MSTPLGHGRPPVAAMAAKRQLSRRLMTQERVQSVGLHCTDLGDWRIRVTLLRGHAPPDDLPDHVDGFGVDLTEDDPAAPHGARPDPLD